MRKYQIIIIILIIPRKFYGILYTNSPLRTQIKRFQKTANVFISFSKKGENKLKAACPAEGRRHLRWCSTERQFPLVRSQNQSVNVDVMIGDSWLFGWSGLQVGLRRHFILLLKPTSNTDTKEQSILERHLNLETFQSFDFSFIVVESLIWEKKAQYYNIRQIISNWLITI